MKNTYLYHGEVITASSKRKAIQVIALDLDRLSDSTKQLYERMNEGDYFDYNSRTDDDFQEYIDNTIQDEIHDIIKSDKYLIKKCIERRSPNASIVWDALYRAFNAVKKRCHINVSVTGDKMKNWFIYNGTNYKKALKNIVDEMTDFREELRESEK